MFRRKNNKGLFDKKNAGRDLDNLLNLACELANKELKKHPGIKGKERVMLFNKAISDAMKTLKAQKESA